MTSMTARTKAFHQLHASGCFVIPNPWDAGSAHLLVQLGFKALATTSSGFAWSTGRSDNQIAREDALEHFRRLTARVDVPVSADFQAGFATQTAGVAANVTAAVATGIAGISIEDATYDPAHPLLEFARAVERIQAARAAIDASGTGVLLTARSEGFIVGRPDLDETVRRLTAYADAGADCLYAPGIYNLEQLAVIVAAVSPKPVNVLVGSNFASVSELAAIGVRRISVGGALARTAWTGFLEAATEIATHGTFTGLDHALPFRDLNQRFSS